MEGRAAPSSSPAWCALAPGGRFAAAITDVSAAVAAEDARPPLPDVGEQGHWVFSSLPLDVRPHPRGVLVEWLRHRVSPSGELAEERHTQVLDALGAALGLSRSSLGTG